MVEADRPADREVLPLDGGCPPPGAGRPGARRRHAPGPAPALDERRRPRHLDRQEAPRGDRQAVPLGGPKNPGPLRVTRDEIERLTADLSRGEAELDRLERGPLGVCRGARQPGRPRRPDRSGSGASSMDAERAVELKARQDDAQLRYERYRRAADLRDQVAAKEAPPSVAHAAGRAQGGRRPTAQPRVRDHRAAGWAGQRARRLELSGDRGAPGWKPLARGRGGPGRCRRGSGRW